MVRFFVTGVFIALVFKVSAQEVELTPGKVIDTVRCQANKKQSYALYLPKNYDKMMEWISVIFFYDPGARGNVPVSMYSSLAEKYRCILVGSNNSRNGPFNATRESEQAILKDVENRFSIPKSRLFISGFSGGARASVFLSLQQKRYAGIIACGAAFPTNTKLTANDNIPFVEIVGNVDFNLIEALETDDYLNKIDYPHSLILFQGTHTWPPVSVYDQAIFWQLLRISAPYSEGKKTYINPKTANPDYVNILLEKVNREINAGELAMAAWSFNHATITTAKVDSQKVKLLANPLLSKQRKKFETVIETEKELLREFYTLYGKINYGNQEPIFIEKEWTSLFTTIKKFAKSDDVMERQLYERLFQQVRIGCFEGYRGQAELKRYLQASLMANVLILLQPDYQTYVLLARSCVKMDRKEEALTALSKSAELGLSDVAALDQSDFSSLVKEKKFVAVKKQVELNAKKR